MAGDRQTEFARPRARAYEYPVIGRACCDGGVGLERGLHSVRLVFIFQIFDGVAEELLGFVSSAFVRFFLLKLDYLPPETSDLAEVLGQLLDHRGIEHGDV